MQLFEFEERRVDLRAKLIRLFAVRLLLHLDELRSHFSSTFRSTAYSFFQHANAVDQSLNSFFVHLNVFHPRVVLDGGKTRTDRRAIRIVTRRFQRLRMMNFHARFRTLDERT